MQAPDRALQRGSRLAATLRMALPLALAGCGPALTPAIPRPAPVDSVPAPRPAPRPAPNTSPRDTAPRPLPATPRPSTPTPRRDVSLTPPEFAREFRGVWVASVANIDWPSSRTLGTVQQQRELLELLDRAVALRLNAVIFQVRPAADALYASELEPWSEYLTGAQGRRPDPYWDPLEFAVKEAHARGLELHAWFNPYRARHTDARSPLAPSHIARTNPSLVRPYAGYLWMDPGEAAVRERTLRVVTDVVRRYDIDGVHIDDYFYPYPENDRRGREIAFPDDRSWQKYRRAGGTLARDDWRRDNVNKLVEALYTRIRATKPWVKFGISPFGIWRPGYPAQIRGLDAYDKLYADARKWLNAGWVDYFTPQLYWPSTRVQQSYAALLGWWVSENTHNRHMWAGNFTSRAGAAGASAFSVGELLEQIRLTRAQPGAMGNVHFSMKPFLQNQGGMNDALVQGPYARPALVPPSPWLQVPVPAKPAVRIDSADGIPAVVVGAATAASRPWQWTVRVRTDTGWVSAILPGTRARWPLPRGVAVTAVVVTAISRSGTESASTSLTIASSLPSSSAPPGRGRSDAP